MEFPHVEAMYRELAPQRWQMISIIGPPTDTTAAMMLENGATLPTAMDAREYDDTTSVPRQYKAGSKIWFVIDSTRRVHYVGQYHPERMRNALATLGVTWRKKGKH